MLTHHYFASCPRGLEEVLQQELMEIHANDIKRVDGGMLFSGDKEVLYKANLSSRIATRILCLVKQGSYENEDDIFNAALSVEWTTWFALEKTIKVSTTAIQCPLKSIDFMTLRIKDAVCDIFREKTGKRPDVEVRDPDIRIHLFLEKNNFSLYIDTSGAPLHQRGFRTASVEAPIKENLAAGIIKLSGWNPGEPFLDPMCGSGTFLIEAAMIASNQAPGLNRNFGFMAWKSFDNILFSTIKKTYMDQVTKKDFLKIYGSDKDLRAIRVSKKNLTLAGFENSVQLVCKQFSEITPPYSEGVLVTNPPYGERIGEELDSAYPEWATSLKQSFAGWRTYFLTNDFRMPKLMRLSPSKKTPLYNGALDCRLFEIKMVAGSNRK
ncbi:class I SAM-dependent RNA methyltransferase [Methylophilaceae bacterium]|nr:class I SAM-dependent RNA methyltransferase [Methylophilaceae bacterium]MDA9087983.1 class I SAM-dependent RNA methyltransferase [Methylophilaceae bacterium]MDB9716883.1 class I SAM-dependent RNA methyltransferase [Methylophilaceae bacterium]MDC1114201.1 class I SAM-dependent RNA methyltransferase [Methylophilaceae bacterium]